MIVFDLTSNILNNTTLHYIYYSKNHQEFTRDRKRKNASV
uniref:Uncharacterized protein n=1 Tax=Rhizophora mucronata TaxID=61149 RepID=A0A2P2NGE2_RHIMU